MPPTSRYVRDHVAALARAIAERAPVDWDAAEASGDEAVRDVVRELRVIAGIAALHGDAATGPAASRSWGAFRIVEPVGHGTYGDVYRAIDTRLDREVALKLLRPDDADGVGATTLEEARLLARVRHPNVVTIHGADEIDGRVGLWMEFVEGRTLEQLLQEDGPLPPAAIAGVGLDVCRALQAVHDAGLLHRDVKAQNVMRDAHGRHVLMDFGAGRHAANAGATDVAGTPLYLAPELLDGAPASRQSDVYSIGVLLFHLATGRYPVEGRTLVQLRASHRTGKRVELRSLRPDLPDALLELIERALSRGASERFGSAGEVADAAAPLVEEAPARKRTTAAAIVAAALLVLTAAGATSWLARDRAPETSAGLRTRLLWDGAPDITGTTSADGRLLSFVDWSQGVLGVRNLVTGQTHTRRLAAEVLHGLGGRTALSPDGDWVAYTWATLPPTSGRRSGRYRLGAVSVSDEAMITPSMTPADYADVFCWSPDGRSIAVMVARAGGSAIEVVPMDGGPPRTVADLGGDGPTP